MCIHDCTFKFIFQPQCESYEALCAKIYVDQHTEDKKPLVIGYNFLCACEHGFKCPDREDNDDVKEVFESDNRGTYVARYCVETHSAYHR